jgi:hypothetical protein
MQLNGAFWAELSIAIVREELPFDLSVALDLNDLEFYLITCIEKAIPRRTLMSSPSQKPFLNFSGRACLGSHLPNSEVEPAMLTVSP